MNLTAMLEDIEFRAIASFTRHMPPWPGAGTLANTLAAFHLRRQRRTRLVLAWGAKFEVDIAGSACQRAVAFFPQMYDRREIAFLRRCLHPGDTFVDIGAHIGAYTIVGAVAVGAGGRVIAVEAVPATFGRLEHNIELNRLTNVSALCAGVSDRSERRVLQRNQANSGGNRLVGGEGDIECMSLLTLLKAQGLSAVALMKIDIEGMEHIVLSAFLKEAPRSIWPAHLIIENNRKKGGAADALQLVKEAGYVQRGESGLNSLLSLAHP